MQHSGLIVFANNTDRIVDNLFIGGNPTDDEVTKFRFLVAMNHAPRYHIPYQTYVLTYPINDAEYLPDTRQLIQIAKCVEGYVKQGPTLVHCTAGLNRSAMMIGMVLINQGMCAEQAIALIRQKRGQDALTNQTFIAWLYHYADQRFVTQE